MLSLFRAVLRRELLLALRQRGVLAHHVLFFALVVALFPLGTRADSDLLVAVAPALIWMAVLLAVLLSLSRVFQPDYVDGTLAQYVLGPEPLALIVLAKAAVHWLTTGAVFALVGPFLTLLFGVPARATGVMMASLALGTPTLVLIGAIGAALTLSLPRAGLLLSLLVFPLYVPVLIFGAGAMRAAIVGLPAAGPLYMLAAMLALGVTGAPWAVAAALRISLE
ncbi:heme exporter protein CcmB [Salinisphaera orenii]|uniref:heme exporter protein CcmB n=1 Tax=Salinisphaera orenii TaxID=856731 RepID=UPI000DBEA277